MIPNRTNSILTKLLEKALLQVGSSILYIKIITYAEN